MSNEQPHAPHNFYLESQVCTAVDCAMFVYTNELVCNSHHGTVRSRLYQFILTECTFCVFLTTKTIFWDTNLQSNRKEVHLSANSDSFFDRNMTVLELAIRLLMTL